MQQSSQIKYKDRYEKIEHIGEGTYGTVFKARDIIKNQFVAIKKLKIDKDESGFPATALREVAILKTMKHKNIVKLLDVLYFPLENKAYLIFEYVDEDLKKHCERLQKMVGWPTQYLIKSYIFQILQAIDYCHQSRILHRDLKPQNILVDQSGTLKIADFGLAKAFCLPLKQMTHEVETLWYRAPEILLGSKSYSFSIDMWTVGLIFAELVLCHPLLPGDSEIDQIFKIFNFFGTPNEQDWPELVTYSEFKKTLPRFKPQKLDIIFNKLEPNGRDLLQQMLILNPNKRISARQALNHPYFQGMDFEDNKELKDDHYKNKQYKANKNNI